MGQGTETVSGQCVEAFEGGAVGRVELIGAPGGVDDHVVDEHHTLVPVVEGGQLTDHGQDGIGVSEVIGRRLGQVLHLPHDVVTEIADQPGMERGEVGQVGRVERLQDGLQGGQGAGLSGDPVAGGGIEVERSFRGDHGPPGRDGGQGVSADEGVPTPAFPALHRLQEEAGPALGLHDLEEGGHRRERVSHQLAPHRDDAVMGGEREEALPAGTVGRGHRPVAGSRDPPSASGPKAR